jgi:hypothetical protein
MCCSAVCLGRALFPARRLPLARCRDLVSDFSWR